MVDGLSGLPGQAVVHHVHLVQQQDIETVVNLFLGMVGIGVMGIQSSRNIASQGHVLSMADGHLGQIGPCALWHALEDLN